jgi:hypothetical protein
MMTLDEAIDRLRAVRSLPQLLVYLRDELNWPLPNVIADDLTFEWTTEELGLDQDAAVGIKEIKQLRPLPIDTKQPWGI